MCRLSAGASPVPRHGHGTDAGTGRSEGVGCVIARLPLVSDFLKLESASGILLIIAAVFAMLLANSPLASYYVWLLDMPVEVRVGPLEIAKPLLLWINDGLMAIFFFLVGLELKREMIEGELSQPGNIALPALGAVGGMAIPAAIYALINYDDVVALQGWAIPAATDIAFALGVLSLLGKRVPVSLKVFLASLAIFDDVGAIIIIALFYTSKLSLTAIGVVMICLPLLLMMNRRGVTEIAPYVFVGLIMWVSLLKSGVHATLAGVALALFIPMRDRHNPERSPLREVEHDLHTVVAFVILPLFAFANAGIDFSGIGVGELLHPVPVGIAAGLFIGKQVGVLMACWAGVKLGVARLPEGSDWLMLYGVSVLCGIGFTMSLFIGSLAFEDLGIAKVFDERIGIVIGSFCSAAVGYVVLRYALQRSADSRGERPT